MTEADRIRAMRDEGKIDDAQAERLLAAVDAIEAAEREDAMHAQAAQAGEVNQAEPAPQAAATTHDEPKAETGPSSTAREDDPIQAVVVATAGLGNEVGKAVRDAMKDVVGSMRSSASAASSTTAGATASTPPRPEVPRGPSATSGAAERWLSLEVFAGAIDVKADPEAQEVHATSKNGAVDVVPTDRGWALTHDKEAGGTWLERLVNVGDSRIKVTVPPGTGVDMNVKAGNVELRGVPALTGRLLAGNLDAKGLRAVDLNVKAGNVDLHLDPMPGHHEVSLAAGDLTVYLPETADATVAGSVKVGDASAFSPIVSERANMVAGSLHGVLGAGSATLDLRVGTGDLDVKRSHHGN